MLGPSDLAQTIRISFMFDARKAGAHRRFLGPVPLGPLSLNLEPGSYNAIFWYGPNAHDGRSGTGAI